MAEKVCMLLVAHADDTEFLAGGTIAGMAAEGYDIYEVISTNNERGSFELDGQTLIRDSVKEAGEAARILGKKDVIFLDYPDGMISDYPLNELREKFIRLIREKRPQVVFTFDPWAPFEPHPDHRAVAMAAVEAVSFAHMPLFHPEHKEDGLEPHLVAEQYYFAKAPVHANRVVDITDHIDKKVDALCAHNSQMKLTIDEIRMSLEATGGVPEKLTLLDRENYRPAIELMIKAYAQEVGKKAGYSYGEEFRYEKAGGALVDAVREFVRAGQ